jgi:hypothetical protein
MSEKIDKFIHRIVNLLKYFNEAGEFIGYSIASATKSKI